MQFTRFIFRTEAGRGVFFSEESGGEICFVWICGRGLAPFRSLCRVREAALYRIKTMRTRNILRQLNYKRFRKQKPTKKEIPAQSSLSGDLCRDQSQVVSMVRTSPSGPVISNTPFSATNLAVPGVLMNLP